MRSEAVRCAEHQPASLPDRWRLSCTSGQLALAGQPATGWWSNVRRGPGGELLGGHRCSLFCRVSDVPHFLPVLFSPLALTRHPDLYSSRSESYWTAVVGEFDITKADPGEQVLRVNRIIPHPKVTVVGCADWNQCCVLVSLQHFIVKRSVSFLCFFHSSIQRHSTMTLPSWSCRRQ